MRWEDDNEWLVGRDLEEGSNIKVLFQHSPKETK